jgi:hypothetical protein
VCHGRKNDRRANTDGHNITFNCPAIPESSGQKVKKGGELIASFFCGG